MSRRALTLAIALLPPSRRAWGEAMKGEYAHLDVGQSGFAWGCLGSALKENVTTGEGWARIGFGFVLMFAVLLGFAVTYSLAKTLTETSYWTALQATLALPLVVQFVIPVVLGLGAVKAMKAPTHRSYLARIGYMTVSKLTLSFGAVYASMFCGCAILRLSIGARASGLDGMLIAGLIFGALFLAVGWFSQRSTRSMRNAASIGMVVNSAIWAFVYLIEPPVSQHLTKFILPNSIFGNVILALIASAGVLFMWMQRSSQTST